MAEPKKIPRPLPQVAPNNIAVEAARKASATVPVVMVASIDPVAAGRGYTSMKPVEQAQLRVEKRAAIGLTGQGRCCCAPTVHGLRCE